MSEIRYPQWRDRNETVNYPFSQASSMENADGDVIPQGVFLDAIFYPVGGQENFYLSEIYVDIDTIRVYMGDDGSDRRAWAEYNRFDPPENLRFVDEYGRPAGLIVSDSFRLATFSAWSNGSHAFTLTQAAVVARCYVPAPGVGIRGFILDDGEIVSGDVWLVGDNGIVLSYDIGYSQERCGVTTSYPTIRVDVIGDTLHRRRVCEGADAFETPRFIETVSFCKPPKAAIKGQPDGAGIVIEICILFNGYDDCADALTSLKNIFSDLSDTVDGLRDNAQFKWTFLSYKDIDEQLPGYAVELPMAENLNDVLNNLLQDVVTADNSDGYDGHLVGMRSIANYWQHSLGGSDASDKFLFVLGLNPGGEEVLEGDSYPALDDLVADLASRGIMTFFINFDADTAGLDGTYPSASGENQASYIVAELESNSVAADLLSDVSQTDEATISNYIWMSIDANAGTGAPEVPETEQNCYTCGPGDNGNVKIAVGTSLTSDPILRIRPVAAGMLLELVGEKLEGVK